jgi:ABC-type transport system involved in multi-copper enzyme maturation permease subunit
MEAASVSILLRHFSPLRLMGPLSDKELRVASRRGRNYALRAGYLLLLCLLMLSAWYSMVGLRRAGPATVWVSRAAEMSTYTTGTIVWFQFAAAQLIAAVMLCSSFSDEMRRGTLGTLLTTPIRSTQIIMGKLLGGLLQVVLLLGLSLPALAILRVQGGVEWGFVVAASCITLSAVVFAGVLSLWLSTHFRHPYKAISAGAVVYFTIFLILPAIATALAWAGLFDRRGTSYILDLVNPFRALFRVMQQIGGMGAPPAPWLPWPMHCAVLGIVTVLILGATVRRVRQAAVGDGCIRVEKRFRPVERLRGSPLIWKDNPCAAFQWRWDNIAVGAAAMAICGVAISVDVRRVPYLYLYLHYIASAIWLLALLRLSIAVAGGITREKESGAWPVLLTTPLDDREIVRTKAKAALRRNAVLLLCAFAVQMCLFFRTAGLLNVYYGVFHVLSSAADIVCIVGAGSYFGVRLRTTTVAAAATLGTYLCLSYLIGGLVNSMFLRLVWPAMTSSRGPTARIMLLGFGTSIGVVVVEFFLGRHLMRRACRTVRQYVF